MTNGTRHEVAVAPTSCGKNKSPPHILPAENSPRNPSGLAGRHAADAAFHDRREAGSPPWRRNEAALAKARQQAVAERDQAVAKRDFIVKFVADVVAAFDQCRGLSFEATAEGVDAR